MEFVNVNVLGKEFSLKVNEINFEYKKNTLQEINGELKETSSRIWSRFGKLTKLTTYYPDGRLKDVTTFFDTDKKKIPAKIAVQDLSVQKSVVTTKYDDKNRLIKMETSEGDFEEYTYFDDTDKLHECHTNYDGTDTLQIYNTDGVVVKSSVRTNIYDSYFEFDDQRRLIGYQVENMKRTKSLLGNEETVNVKIENIMYDNDDPEKLNIDVVNEQMAKFVDGKLVHDCSIVKDNDSDDKRCDESKYQYDQDGNLIKITDMVKAISGNVTKIISNTVHATEKIIDENGEVAFITTMKNKEFDNVVTNIKIIKDYGYIKKYYNYNGVLITEDIAVEKDDHTIVYAKAKDGYVLAKYEKNDKSFSVRSEMVDEGIKITDEYPLERYIIGCEIHNDEMDLSFHIDNTVMTYKTYSGTKETPTSSLKISSVGSVNMDFLNIRNVISSYIAENYKSELKEIEEVIKNYKFDF